MTLEDKTDSGQILLGDRLTPRPNWHEYFMAIAKVVSTRSTCSSRPVGCVITLNNRILVTGYNGAPPGKAHCTDLGQNGEIYCARRANKIPDHLKHSACQSIHAEENAIKIASHLGLNNLINGASIYITLSPCIKCIDLLSSYGIAHVFYELAYSSIDSVRDQNWKKHAISSFKTYQQIGLSPESTQKISGAISGTTSTRLLSSS